MHIAIIGAGASGLNAARHTIANNFDCTVFEQTGEIGGTWVYTDDVGQDQFGMAVHTSMYQGLRTNLPKEVMGFPDFPMKDCDISYLPQKDVLDFLHDYANKFGLQKYIKFYNHVKIIKPIANDRWELISMDVRTKVETRYEFDAVMVCNGHYHKPRYAQLNGIQNFKGVQKHSHDYRKPEEFKNHRVVIIGAGPSGVDLAFHICNEAEKVILSHHLQEKIDTKFPKHVIQKPDIDRVTENSVIFKDGTEEKVDTIFYCTGYEYSYPFLSKECGIIVDDNYVQPLYKQLININHPTMALVGLPFYVCAFIMFDLQVRFFLKTLNGSFKLPSAEEMNQDRLKEMQKRWDLGFTKRQAHMMGPLQNTYYDDLCLTANLEPIPIVYTNLHNESSRRFLEDLIHFRDDAYKIIDENNFIQTAFGS